MAYPTDSLSATLAQVDAAARELRSLAARQITQLAAANVESSAVLGIYMRLRAYQQRFSAAAQVEGLAAYAQAAKGNDTLDIAAEFVAMLAAIDAAADWIGAALPKDASGYLLVQTLGENGPIDRQFTPAQTAGLRTALQGIVDTIAP